MSKLREKKNTCLVTCAFSSLHRRIIPKIFFSSSKACILYKGVNNLSWFREF